MEWPDQPSLEISNFSAKYDNHLPLVLKNLSISINAKEKIFIGGTSGSCRGVTWMKGAKKIF